MCRNENQGTQFLCPHTESLLLRMSMNHWDKLSKTKAGWTFQWTKDAVDLACFSLFIYWTDLEHITMSTVVVLSGEYSVLNDLSLPCISTLMWPLRKGKSFFSYNLNFSWGSKGVACKDKCTHTHTHTLEIPLLQLGHVELLVFI